MKVISLGKEPLYYVQKSFRKDNIAALRTRAHPQIPLKLLRTNNTLFKKMLSTRNSYVDDAYSISAKNFGLR